MPEGTESQMTEQELTALIAKVAGETVGPALEEALKPLSKAQGEFLEGMAKYQRDEKPLEKQLGKWPFGRKIRALAMGNNDPEKAAFEINKAQGWPLAVREPTMKWLEHVKTTLTAGTAATAGDMVFPQYDSEWIDLLRNNAVIRGQARTVPMPRGATSRRKQTGAATAYYQGELGPMTESNQTVGRVNLSYKKLTALTVVSNDLIRFSGGEADRFVQEDVLRVSALREDQAFLVGNPPTDAGSPQGVRYQTHADNIAAAAGAALANFQSDLTDSINLVQKNNIPATPANSGFLMSPSTFWTIYGLTTTTGDWVFAQGLQQAQPRLLGFPVYITTQLETGNSFIGASAGMVMFAHFPSLEIHDSMMRTVATYPGGAYYDSSAGAVASGISNDETVITCVAEHDFLQVYDKAAAIKTGYST